MAGMRVRASWWVLLPMSAGLACPAGVSLTGSDERPADGSGTSDEAAVDLDGVESEVHGAPEAAAADCRPMDAVCPSHTYCPAVGFLPWRWDGYRCVVVGCNCRCDGADCDSGFETGEDCIADYRA